MKVKTIMSILLAASLLLGTAACGLSEQELQEQRYIETARAVAEEIPLPDWYCPVHGVICEPEDIKIEIASYDTSTGESTFSISCLVDCPKFYFWDVLSGHGEHRFHLQCDVYGEDFIPLSALTDDTIEKYWR